MLGERLLVICYRRRMRLLILPLAACVLACAQPSDVHKDTLANGMKVLIQEDHNIPSVAMYFFFEIGSRNERPGITGISHFFEHMMFNGARKYGPGQFDVQMEKSGGNNNAFTTEDDTVYTDWFSSDALELMMDMEADRIQNLSFDPKIVESERGVVYSERRTSVDNSNFGTLFEQLRAAAYIAHPYHWPVIGWPSDIEAWTMDDLKNHFRMGYAPNNCIMVVVGDVKTSHVLELARKYLEPIPQRAASARHSNQRARATGRASRDGGEARAIAYRDGGLSRSGIQASGRRRAGSARSRALQRPKFAAVFEAGG